MKIPKRLPFPSPCGVLVLKLHDCAHENGKRFVFPSPCGVLVLKFPLKKRG